MREIALVNMPFADVHRPSIALTQLRSVVRSARSDVSVDIFYLNLDFAESFGLKDYAVVANTMESLISGMGEWFFRPIAFPDAPDNSDAYLRRYLRHFGAQPGAGEKGPDRAQAKGRAPPRRSHRSLPSRRLQDRGGDVDVPAERRVVRSRPADQGQKPRGGDGDRRGEL